MRSNCVLCCSTEQNVCWEGGRDPLPWQGSCDPRVSGLDVAMRAQWLGLVLDAVVELAQIWEFLAGKGMLRFPANKLPANQPSGAETVHRIALKPSSQLSCSQTHTGV